MTANGQVSDAPVRIGVVETNRLYRDSLSTALACQADFELAFAVPVPDEVPSASKADVLIFSTAYPSEAFGEGLALEYWRIRCPNSRFLLVTPCRARKTIQAVIASGVEGYAIRNTVSIEALYMLIRQARHQPPALCDETVRILQQPPHESDLTFRELQTIQLLHTLGLTNRKRVARQLDMSVETLNVHLRNACQKLGASGAGEVVQRCVEMGMIE